MPRGAGIAVAPTPAEMGSTLAKLLAERDRRLNWRGETLMLAGYYLRSELR